jgi:hypothetical protein
MEFECGDIFLTDSDKFGPRIVKFLMAAPTLWQWLWRAARGTQEPVRFYHAGMLLSNEKLIEQQWKVQYAPASKILPWTVVVYRCKTLAALDGINTDLIARRAIEDLDKLYDIPQLIGKTLTWLTGIKWFVRFLGWISKEEEICVTRVAHWYSGICNFGVKDHSEITTKIIDEYCRAHPEEWEIVYVHAKI